jgi:hypothetical protein
MELAQRILKLSELIDETFCWRWTGATEGRKRYGKITVGGRSRLAHRVSYEVFRDRSEIEGKQTHHTCLNKWCVNPWHMKPVTPKGHVAEHIEAQGFWGRPKLPPEVLRAHERERRRTYRLHYPEKYRDRIEPRTPVTKRSTPINGESAAGPRKHAAVHASGSRNHSLLLAIQMIGILKPPGSWQLKVSPGLEALFSTNINVMSRAVQGLFGNVSRWKSTKLSANPSLPNVAQGCNPKEDRERNTPPGVPRLQVSPQGEGGGVGSQERLSGVKKHPWGLYDLGPIGSEGGL